VAPYCCALFKVGAPLCYYEAGDSGLGIDFAALFFDEGDEVFGGADVGGSGTGAWGRIGSTRVGACVADPAAGGGGLVDVDAAALSPREHPSVSASPWSQ
jgi:hypothetical protein